MGHCRLKPSLTFRQQAFGGTLGAPRGGGGACAAAQGHRRWVACAQESRGLVECPAMPRNASVEPARDPGERLVEALAIHEEQA